MTEQKQSLLLVDGMALLFRAFYATSVTGQFMYNSKGIPTNGVQGFLKHLLTATSKFTPSHIAICWDMGSHTFRNDLYADYKGNRGAPPEELIPQFDLVKEVVDAFDIPNIGVPGFEADDCIGTISQNYAKKLNIHILTGDKDILQLLNDNVKVALLQKGFGNYSVYTKEMFVEERAILPKQMIDVKALMGDASDNYPGVKGIGEKTALKLIQQYETIEGIVSHLDKLPKSQKTKIENDLDMLYLSRKLAEIHCEVPLSFSIEEAIVQFNYDKINEKMNDIEMKGLSRFLPELNNVAL